MHYTLKENDCGDILGLVWFYGISTIVGYLMSDLVYRYIIYE